MPPTAPPSALPSLGASAGRTRYRVLGLLFVMVVINYLDRANLSIAASDVARDLSIDNAHRGWLFSAFGWVYATLQIPGGWLVDRVRPRLLYALVCALWSTATVFQGMAGTFAVLLSLRLMLGLFETPAYPICNRVVTTWFPDRERAGAIGLYTSGQFVGIAFLTPVLVSAQRAFGWQSVFYITGAIGLGWSLIWYLVYREPTESTSLTAAELGYIRDGGGVVPTSKASKAAFSWDDLGLILSQRKLWGIYLGQFALTSTLWFFLTWFPTYLNEYRHIDIKVYAMWPYLAAFIGVICSGLVSDFMIRRGISATTARKIPIVSGLILGAAIIGANFVDRPLFVIFFLMIAFFGNGFASIAWVMVSSLAPKRLIGLTGGVFNFFGNLPSIIVPIAVGYLVKNFGFATALGFIGTIALLGAASYIFLVGRVERVEA